MSWLWRLAWFLFKGYAQKQALSRAKRKGVIFYLKFLNGTRHALILTLIGILVLQVIVLAGIGALVTGVWLLDLDTNTKLWILFGTFSTIFLLPVLGAAFALNERVWYKATGANKLVEDLLEQDEAA